MGDFNTRPQKCCPWREIELTVSHDLRQYVRDTTWNHDDLGDMVTGYEEMAPLYRPTFHKRFKRDGHDECASAEFKDSVKPSQSPARLATRKAFLSNTSANDEKDFTEALLAVNKGEFNPDCEKPVKPAKHTLCWGGDPLRESCEQGKCFNTVDRSHCPGYTDRIIYKGDAISPLNYWPIESLVEADHTPVVATFQLQ